MKKMICHCSNVSRSTIIKEIKKGAVTLEDIRKAIGACTLGKCKTLSPTKKCCFPVILELLKEYCRNSILRAISDIQILSIYNLFINSHGIIRKRQLKSAW